MQLLNFTIIKLTLCLIIGIFIGYWLDVSFTISLLIVIALLVCSLCSLLLTQTKFKNNIWFGFFIFLLMIWVGILTTNTHNKKNNSKHYTHLSLVKNKALKSITFKVTDVLKSGIYYDKYFIDILKINNTNTTGKLLLNIKKDTTNSTLKIDDVFITKTLFKDIKAPLNPNQFDYKNYLKKKYIYHQLFVSNQSLLKTKTKSTSVFGIANEIRNHIHLKLKPYNFNTDEFAIINALLLGQRQNISKETYTQYINAGAVHILAVSGLHVGVILIILSFILKPLEQFKRGKLIKTFLLVFALWAFAIITGLSASVTRAVTMFSIVAIAANLKRPTNIFNTLAISIFIILLFKPLFLFNIGFQLSYLAVFTIVIIDPYLYKLWKPKNWFIDKYWHTLTISISAQLGIIPVSLYYFHQFPSLFLISNLVIIPLLGFILGFGILVITLAILNLLPQLLANFYAYTIKVMNNFVAWVSHQEAFVFNDIYFSLLHLVVAYILIFTLTRFLIKKSYKTLQAFLISILLIQITISYSNYNSSKNQFIIFHKNRHSILANVSQNKMHVFNNMDVLGSNIIKNYTQNNRIKYKERANIKSVYTLKNKTLLVIDSLGVYNVKSFKPDYILLRDSPKINLSRLIDSIKPKCIIADGSNYKSYTEQWSNICKNKKTTFHQTNKKGAFIIDY